MLSKNKLVKISLYLLVFLAFFWGTANITAGQAAQNETPSPELVGKPIARNIHNNLTVSVNKISLDSANNKTDIVSCVDLPNNSDWLPYAVIYDGLEKIPAEQLILIDYKNPETTRSSHRCYHFIFSKAVASESVKFTIEKLQTTIPETITSEMCNNAQEKIKREHSSFVFSCVISDHMMAYEITSTPKEMSEAEAYLLINDALTDTVNGPWEMDVKVP